MGARWSLCIHAGISCACSEGAGYSQACRYSWRKRDMGTLGLPFLATQVEDRVRVQLLQELLPTQLTAPILSREMKSSSLPKLPHSSGSVLLLHT